MEEILKKIEELIRLMGFNKKDVKVGADEEHRKISLKINDEVVQGKVTPQIMSAFNLLINQILRKHNESHCVVDLNYYHKERERLIIELARAAAKKAIMTKENIELPTMNSYERRIVHVEIATHPELETESIDQKERRRVVIKHLKDN